MASGTGQISTAIQGGQDRVRDLNHQIDDWDVRLSDRQDALKRQFTAMEVALGQLREQSSWLAGQISSLAGSA